MTQFSAFGQGGHGVGAVTLRKHTPGMGTPVMNGATVSVRHLSCAHRLFQPTGPGKVETVAAHPLQTGPGARDPSSGKSENLLERGY